MSITIHPLSVGLQAASPEARTGRLQAASPEARTGRSGQEEIYL